MSKIKIETLSPVHVGNGVFLQKGNDFIEISDGDDSDIYVLNIDKLGAVIGTDATSISKWTTAIQNGEAEEFIKSRIHKDYVRYSKRHITNFADFSKNNGTLKECIHDGRGFPYIPGTSIKGAIRTALVAALASEQIVNDLESKPNQADWKTVIYGMEKKLLGDMGNSVFRYLCTGDIYFEKDVEIALRQINLNITQRDRLIDTTKQQVVEAIAAEQISEFRLNINQKFYEKLNKSNLQNLNALFSLINHHTWSLVEYEIENWSEKGDDAIEYIDGMDAIKNVCKSCKPGECVLRLGQGVGWRFITGAWLEQIDNDYFYDKIVPVCRPKSHIYQDYEFPKSRRIGDAMDLFGFVKLTVLSE